MSGILIEFVVVKLKKIPKSEAECLACDRPHKQLNLLRINNSNKNGKGVCAGVSIIALLFFVW
jgi:hypothetical protein